METAAGDNYLKFLGTGGARYVVARQIRGSGGTFVSVDGRSVMLDPGPGALVRAARSRPVLDVTALDGIILTHAHIDHSNDVNILVDAMTHGGIRRRGFLCAPRECLEGEHAVVLRYLRRFLREIVVLEEQQDYEVNGLRFTTSVRHDHSAETYGVTLPVGSSGVSRGTSVSFVVDGRYFEGLAASYAGSDVLVVNVVRYVPHTDSRVRHLSAGDAARLIRAVRPGKAVLTHFGMTMIQAKPWKVAEGLSAETGVEVVAAADGMTLPIVPRSSA
jgi:ribonuclease BN (tRNA processing enzyme)